MAEGQYICAEGGEPAVPPSGQDADLPAFPIDLRGFLRPLLGHVHHSDWDTVLPKPHPTFFLVLGKQWHVTFRA